jgi:hypothetical protein
MNVLAAFFTNKARFLSIFFEFKIWYKGILVFFFFWNKKTEDILFYKFLEDISTKINIFKNTKLDKIELNEANGINTEILLANIGNICNLLQKGQKKIFFKKCLNFFYT